MPISELSEIVCKFGKKKGPLCNLSVLLAPSCEPLEFCYFVTRLKVSIGFQINFYLKCYLRIELFTLGATLQNYLRTCLPGQSRKSVTISMSHRCKFVLVLNFLPRLWSLLTVSRLDCPLENGSVVSKVRPRFKFPATIYKDSSWCGLAKVNIIPEYFPI